MCKFEVQCKCGHVGRKNYIIISFPIIAENAKEAANKARYCPRVKHDHKDAIIDVRKITDEEYYELRLKNNCDQYLKCKCVQDQNGIDLSDRVLEENQTNVKRKKEEEHIVHYFKKEIVRNPKRYFKNLMTYENIEEAVAW